MKKIILSSILLVSTLFSTLSAQSAKKKAEEEKALAEKAQQSENIMHMLKNILINFFFIAIRLAYNLVDII